MGGARRLRGGRPGAERVSGVDSRFRASPIITAHAVRQADVDKRRPGARDVEDPVTDQFVCVTGAGGFVGSQLVRLLLSEGYRVRGTCRNPAKEAHLRQLAGADERLELVAADLLTPGAFDEALADITTVMHTASPYIVDVKDPATELVAPAVEGTLNVLRAAKLHPSIKRVVLTSSVAAVSDEPDKTHTLTEADWNTKSTLKRNPYYYSKTLAEKAAWDFMKTERPGFDLVVINPFAVIGPSLTPALNTTNQFFADVFKKRYPAILGLHYTFVDVRDVALAHVLAMTTPRAKGRYLCAAGGISMRDIMPLIRKHPAAEGANGKHLPRRGLDGGFGNFLVKRIMSRFQPRGSGSYLRTHIGREYRFDASRIKRELGLTFRPVEASIRDTLDDMARWGHIP